MCLPFFPLHQSGILNILFTEVKASLEGVLPSLDDHLRGPPNMWVLMLSPTGHSLTFSFLIPLGIWEMAFHTDLMYKENFFVDEHTTVQVDMMWKTEQMIYSRSEKLFATMVKIPYIGNMSIVLMLPDVGKPDSAIKDMIVQKATLLKSSDMR